MKTVIFSILLAFFTQQVSALPPGCLLAAVNTQDKPGDLSAVCGIGALTVQSYMASRCGGAEEEAQKQFIATCSSAGTSVAAYTATATSSGASTTSSGTITSTPGSSTTSTSTIVSDTTSNPSSSAARTAASTQSTAGAIVHYDEGIGSLAAAAVALVGAVAALS